MAHRPGQPLVTQLITPGLSRWKYLHTVNFLYFNLSAAHRDSLSCKIPLPLPDCYTLSFRSIIHPVST